LALGPTQTPIQWQPMVLSPPRGYSNWSMKVTTRLHLVLRLRMSGAILLLPPSTSS